MYPVHISATLPVIMTEDFHGFLQSVPVNDRKQYL